MTLNQLETLTEDELAIALHIVNVISPMEIPVMQFEPRQLTWFKHDALIKKLLDAFPRVLPEGHATYSSLLHKLGVQHEIKYQAPPAPEPPATASLEVTASNQTTGSV